MKTLYSLIEHQMIIGCITLRQDRNPDAQPPKRTLMKQTSKVKPAQIPKHVEKRAPKEKAMPRRPAEKAMPRRPAHPPHPPKRAKQDPPVLSVGMHIGKEAIYGHTYT